MKRFVLILCTMFFCVAAIAKTINIDWKVGNNIYSQSTCEYGGDLTVPATPPTKYGYTFQGWASFTPIEYLESTGTQWIDTEYYPNNKTGIKIKIQFLSLKNGESVIFGGATSWHNSAFEAFYWDNQLHFTYNNYTVNLEQLRSGDIVEIDWNQNIVKYSINNGALQE